jgi:hypothetical protein
MRNAQPTGTHAPAEHDPLAHTTPQSPQLAGSARKSTQTPPHEMKPTSQPREAQTASRHGPCGQAFPQAPQFWESAARSVQMPEQSVYPAAQAARAVDVASGAGSVAPAVNPITARSTPRRVAIALASVSSRSGFTISAQGLRP